MYVLGLAVWLPVWVIFVDLNPKLFLLLLVMSAKSWKYAFHLMLLTMASTLVIMFLRYAFFAGIGIFLSE